MSKSRQLKINVAIAITLAIVIAGGGWLVQGMIGFQNNLAAPNTRQTIDQYFQLAVESMGNRDYNKAADAWYKLLQLQPEMAEANVNMGFSLYELTQYADAMKYFQHAIDINPYQANGYYGLAICYEKLADFEAAIGAMRSYIHLNKDGGPFMRKARAALWEWEERLKVPNEKDEQITSQ